MTTTNKWAKPTLKPPQTFPSQFRTLSERYCIRFAFSSSRSGRASNRVEFASRKKNKYHLPSIPPSFLKAVPQDIRRPGSLRFCSQDPKMFLWQTALEINVIFPKKQFYFRHISGTLWAKLAMAWQLGNLTLIYTTFSL